MMMTHINLKYYMKYIIITDKYSPFFQPNAYDVHLLIIYNNYYITNYLYATKMNNRILTNI